MTTNRAVGMIPRGLFARIFRWAFGPSGVEEVQAASIARLTKKVHEIQIERLRSTAAIKSDFHQAIRERDDARQSLAEVQADRDAMIAAAFESALMGVDRVLCRELAKLERGE